MNQRKIVWSSKNDHFLITDPLIIDSTIFVGFSNLRDSSTSCLAEISLHDGRIINRIQTPVDTRFPPILQGARMIYATDHTIESLDTKTFKNVTIVDEATTTGFTVHAGKLYFGLRGMHLHTIDSVGSSDSLYLKQMFSDPFVYKDSVYMISEKVLYNITKF